MVVVGGRALRGVEAGARDGHASLGVLETRLHLLQAGFERCEFCGGLLDSVFPLVDLRVEIGYRVFDAENVHELGREGARHSRLWPTTAGLPVAVKLLVGLVLVCVRIHVVYWFLFNA